MALIAISSGSSAGSTHLRKIKMLVSSMPCRGCSPLIPAASLMVERRILISPERLEVTRRSIARHRDELLPGDKPAALSQRDQLADTVTVPGDGKGLPMFDGVHDLPRPRPQVPLCDLRISAHIVKVALCAIECYHRQAGAWHTAPASGSHRARRLPGSTGGARVRDPGILISVGLMTMRTGSTSSRCRW